MSTTDKNADKYFATIEDPAELASAMQDKIRTWRNWCQAKGLISLWMKKLTNYYGISANGNLSQSITPGGSEGELSYIKVNDLHSLLQDQLVLVTSQRPAGMAKAANTDSASLKAAKIGSAIAEYYMSNVGLEAKFVQACEISLLCDESFVDLFWDKEAGDPIAMDPETGMPEMSGDIQMRVHAPWNVARDPGAPIDSQSWYILSYLENKFDMAAAYPKFADNIKLLKSAGIPELPMCKLPDDTDMIYVHLLVQNRCPSVPEGRYSLMIGDDIVVDTTQPYRDFSVERMAPSDVIDGPVGYSSANDILAMEEVTDALHSIITTNNITFGGQSIVAAAGSNLNVSDLGKGMRLFELEPDHVDKLRPLQMTKSAPETFEYINKLESKKEQQTGSSKGVLAQQAIQGASGSAMALIESKSIQYNSGIQRSFYRLLSATMSKLITTLAKYADTPRVARIVGKNRSAGLKEFKYTGKDLSSISSIVYEMINPIIQTQGGRLDMANNLLAKENMIKSPKQYITLVTTGSLESLTQDDEADELLIIEENEWLAEGKPLQAILTEMHEDHIRSHQSVLSSPKAKQDPTLVQSVNNHIQEHIDLWTQLSMSNPGLLMATGQRPLMPPPGPGPGGPPGAAPSGPSGPPGLVGGGPDDQGPPVDQANQPKLPFNPLTHERQEVPGGTIQ